MTSSERLVSVRGVLMSKPGALYELRRRRGHSLRTLAQVAGVSHSGIARLERGAVAVYPATAKRLADALGCEITDIADVVDEVAS